MTFSLFNELLSEGKAKQPKMEYPGVKVTMLHSWGSKLHKALVDLGYGNVIISEGYSDGSTKWSIAVEIEKKFNISKFEDALRKKLNFDGWLSVEFFDLTQLDESALNEGAYVIKNKDGKEKRFKDSNSPEANAWASSSAPAKLAKYSQEWWDASDMEVVPSTPISGKDDVEINRIVKSEFTLTADWSLGKKSIVKRQDVDCAAILVRVSYEITPEDNLGVENTTEESQAILVARDPKKPNKLEFVKYL